MPKSTVGLADIASGERLALLQALDAMGYVASVETGRALSHFTVHGLVLQKDASTPLDTVRAVLTWLAERQIAMMDAIEVHGHQPLEVEFTVSLSHHNLWEAHYRFVLCPTGP